MLCYLKPQLIQYNIHSTQRVTLIFLFLTGIMVQQKRIDTILTRKTLDYNGDSITSTTSPSQRHNFDDSNIQVEELPSKVQRVVPNGLMLILWNIIWENAFKYGNTH